MFNSTSIKQGSVSNEITFNSVAGTLVKSTTNSKFMRFHMNSPLAKRVFNPDKPNRGGEGYSSDPYKEIVVLQVMLCGGDEFLVEYIDIEKE